MLQINRINIQKEENHFPTNPVVDHMEICILGHQTYDSVSLCTHVLFQRIASGRSLKSRGKQAYSLSKFEDFAAVGSG